MHSKMRKVDHETEKENADTTGATKEVVVQDHAATALVQCGRQAVFKGYRTLLNDLGTLH